MKSRFYAYVGLFLILNLAKLCYGNTSEIAKINEAIRQKKANWTAEQNWVTRLSPEQRKKLCGAMPVPDEIKTAALLSLPANEPLPEKFDWRDNNGDWGTEVEDQGQCGSCWAFSAVAQVEAWWKIYNNKPDTLLDLSEQYVLSCSGAGNCEHGGWTHEALTFIKNNGIPKESCMRYKADDSIPCSEACDDWKSQAITIPDWGWITNGEIIVENIKRAVYRHPVSASFVVYSDFQSYKSGVYEHVFGEEEGGHAILIVGWNDEEQSWICKNSWGKDWGDNGYFRIKWGDSQMGASIPFIWDETLKSKAISVSHNELDFSLTVGDTAFKEIVVTNMGTGNLEFSSMDYGNCYGELTPAEWIGLKNGSGKLKPGETATITISIKTRELMPAQYCGTIHFNSNDARDRETPTAKVTVNLNLKAPDHDVVLYQFNMPEQKPRLFEYMNIAATIKNSGINNESDVGVICTGTQNEQQIYTDTSHISLIMKNQSLPVNFEPLRLMDTGDITFQLQLIDIPLDYNDYNNSLNSTVTITNLIDDFELPTNLWTLSNGWGITNAVNGHDGPFSAHVNNGQIPYLNNMDAIIKTKNGFDVRSVEKATIKFWTRYATEQDVDICYVEVSGDDRNWVKRDSLSGIHPAWVQREIGISDFINKGFQHVWLRFRFISDSANTSIGVIIDDVEIYPEDPVGVPSEVKQLTDNSSIAQDWYLCQNYPNPFNPNTTISYHIPQDSHVKLNIYNVLGEKITTLVNSFQKAGHYQRIWDANSQTAGMYFYHIQAGEFQQMRKMILLR